MSINDSYNEEAIAMIAKQNMIRNSLMLTRNELTSK